MPGHAAKGFYISKFSHQHFERKNNYYFVGISRKKNLFKWVVQEIKRYYTFRRLLKWADVIHWVYDDKGLKNNEIRKIRKAGKPSVVEWVGSDIRNPELLFPLNAYYAHAYENGYEYAQYESVWQSKRNQAKFLQYEAIPLVNPEMDLFLDRSMFPERYFVWPRMLLTQFDYRFPDPGNKKPLVLHSPTAKVAKGSEYIIAAVEELKKEVDFDFILLHQFPRAEVMRLMQQCDIFIDQIVLGMYGLASCEAMCYGKPVLCYLMPAVIKNGLPEECPIINTTVESLKSNLRRLLQDGQLRYETGLLCRAYAEKYFDSKKNAERLISVYQAVIAKKIKVEQY